MFDWGIDPFGLHKPFPKSSGGGRRPKPVDAASAHHDNLEPETQPTVEEVPGHPKSVFLKAGWVESTTKFKTEAELFAEYSIPDPDLKKSPVEFQVFHRVDGIFQPYASAQGKPDANGRAIAKVAIHRDREPTGTFRFQTRHAGSPWSEGRDTEREVKQSADGNFAHTHVGGIHFPRDSSFIIPAYLKLFRTLEKAYGQWKKEHASAKVVVFGHAEPDETDPHKLSARRAQTAFAFLIGDFNAWGRVAKEEAWGLWEHQHMLSALGFYKHTVDGLRGRNTDRAVHDFITWLNESQCKNINPMLGLTEEYIRLELYRAYLAHPEHAVNFPSERFRTVCGYPNVGCGEINRYKEGESHNAENRRVTFLLIAESQTFPATFPCQTSVSGQLK
jgi:outer membrane protein OmpA-like peptidoglycan-associated protein